MARLGVDVSHYQGDINFSELKKDADFVFIKATEGIDYVDPKFAENVKGALAAGLDVGVYHFFHSENGVKEQADFLVKTLLDNGVDLHHLEGIILDDEVNGAHLTQPEMEVDVQAFRAEIKALTGEDVVLYSSYDFLLNQIGHVDLPIWLADYTPDGQHVKDLVAKGFNVKYVQYSDQGHVAGINGNVDLDKELEVIKPAPAPAPAPVPAPQKAVPPARYVIKAGETLSGICAHFGVNMADVVKWNNISDPDKIYAGQLILLIQPHINQIKPITDVTEYEVDREGETLTHIALAHGTTVDALLALNPQIKNRNLIYVGQKIKIK